VHAGLVFAQLVPNSAGAASRLKAVRALEDAARAGFPHAQWLLAQQARKTPVYAADSAAALSGTGSGAVSDAVADAVAGAPWSMRTAAPGATHIPAQALTPARPRRAADNGAADARFDLLEQAWTARNWSAYLERALPLARALVHEHDEAGEMRRCAPHEIVLLSRCARLLDPALGVLDGIGSAALAGEPPAASGEPVAFWELAAAEHDRYAQLAMGLRYARMRVDGRRVSSGAGPDNAATPGVGVANFKKAIRWLTLAGEQGLAEAWYALSRIYIKPEFSQRNVADAGRYLEHAAEMGYRDAQLECGHNAWRARRENENNDVRAVYWLQKAAAQGASEAFLLLRKIAPRPVTAPYTDTGSLAGHPGLAGSHPLLGARLELAALFNLTRAEALLLDVAAADQGHCLVIDIRASYGRSKRRLVMVESALERQALDRIVQRFEQVDCGPAGPEGNYRQRLYRLRALLGLTPAAALGNAAEAGAVDDASDIELAA